MGSDRKLDEVSECPRRAQITLVALFRQPPFTPSESLRTLPTESTGARGRGLRGLPWQPGRVESRAWPLENVVFLNSPLPCGGANLQAIASPALTIDY